MGTWTRLPSNDEVAGWGALDDEQGFCGRVAAEAFEAGHRHAGAGGEVVRARTALPECSRSAGSSTRSMRLIVRISRSLMDRGDAPTFGGPAHARCYRLTMDRRALLRPGAVAADGLRCLALGARNPNLP